jgi:hypothetical protein
MRRTLSLALTAFVGLGLYLALTVEDPTEIAYLDTATTTTTVLAQPADINPDWVQVQGMWAAEVATREANFHSWVTAVSAAEAERVAAAARRAEQARVVQTAAVSEPVETAVAEEVPSGDWGATGEVNGYPCGGQLPTCRVLACESGGNPLAENPSSTASGLWQILDSTWNGFGGYSHAAHAPVDVQNAKAAALWANGAGASHWRACL